MKLQNYHINEKYKTSVAYFSMEFAIDQALKIYSGGLGLRAYIHSREGSLKLRVLNSDRS